MRRSLSLVLVAVVVIAVAGAVYLRLAPNKVSAAANVPTATVTRGTLAATVNAAGNITAHQQVNLIFGQTGTVNKVSVQAGDHVKAGDVLAELDSSDLALQVQNAQVNLKIAQDKLAQTKNPNATQDVASARSKVDAAQAALNKLQTGPTSVDLASAQSQVSSAQAAYDAAVKSAGTANNQLTSAAAALDKATQALQKAQAAYDRVSSNPDIASRPEALALQSATTDYNQAKADYESLASTANTDAASKVASARSQVEQAQASLVKLKTPPSQDDLAQAQATLDQAKNDLSKLLAGPDANSLDIAQNSVDQAQIALQQAQIKFQQAKILAPFDSVVTQVNVVAGQSAPSGANSSAIQLADLDHLEIVVDLAEVDVNRVKIGQQAQITLDALPDANLTGQVSAISPAGILQQGVVNYPVTISLLNPPSGVKTGMTANLNLIVDQRDNVLMVPNRAVRTQGRQRLVTVLFEGQQIQVPVQVGLSNDTSTEITSGLKEGDEVVLGVTNTQTTGGAGAFRGGPGGAIFGR